MRVSFDHLGQLVGFGVEFVGVAQLLQIVDAELVHQACAQRVAHHVYRRPEAITAKSNQYTMVKQSHT